MVEIPCRSQQMMMSTDEGDWCVCWLTRKECPYWKFAEEHYCEQFTERDY